MRDVLPDVDAWTARGDAAAHADELMWAERSEGREEGGVLLFDDAALSVALRSPAGYVGAMGSTRTQNKRRERLLAVGLTDEEPERLAAPIGLDPGSVTPQETALSVMSEIVAVRRGRDGGRRVDTRRRVQEVGA
jgi:xanthine/CO dehydrogenase XdhC/CoxF family maturation factor